MREPFEPIDYEKFAERLRNLRDSNGIEDTDIAEKLNISAQAVGKWMNAKNLPDSQHICDLSDLFGGVQITFLRERLMITEEKPK